MGALYLCGESHVVHSNVEGQPLFALLGMESNQKMYSVLRGTETFQIVNMNPRKSAETTLLSRMSQWKLQFKHQTLNCLIAMHVLYNAKRPENGALKLGYCYYAAFGNRGNERMDGSLFHDAELCNEIGPLGLRS